MNFLIKFTVAVISIELFHGKKLMTNSSETDQNRIERSTTFLTPWFSLLKMNPAKNVRPQSITDFFNTIRNEYHLPLGLTEPYDEYDFVIVGAGSAGCVLANRLSENANEWTVLALEAGGTESIVNEVPIMAGALQGTDFNWGYRMDKVDGLCLAMDDQQCHWPKGRAVGGSSAINYMIYSRGSRADWDRIAAEGNPGWAYDDVLPYFVKSERANLKSFSESPYHGTDGLLSVEHVSYRTPLVETFMRAGEELGHATNVDYNRENHDGFSYVQATTLKGRRHSAASAFLLPFRRRQNLHVLPFSRATRIIIDKDTKRAESVEFVRNKRKRRVRARREIILSAGTIGSAQLLMLSGVGPAEHLLDKGIEVIEDLQVGQNMYDHIAYLGNVFLVNRSGLGLIESEVLTWRNSIRWFADGSGPFASVGGVEAIGYHKTSVAKHNLPDIELLFTSGGIAATRSGVVRKGMKMRDDFFDQLYGDVVGRDAWSIIPMLMHPESKGRLLLKSSNPYAHPSLYYDYFKSKRDERALIEGIKYTIKLAETEAFRRVGSRLHDKKAPGCEGEEFGSDEYWSCACARIASTLHHHVGTCRMAPRGDASGVVDARLRVRGVGKLRVGDVSVLPMPIGAHTNAPAIMIGEKLADMIEEDWAV